MKTWQKIAVMKTLTKLNAIETKKRIHQIKYNKIKNMTFESLEIIDDL
jgi:hypothetical protein